MIQLRIDHPAAVPPRRSGRAAAGTSLVETLIASALLLVVAVAIFPMFHRSVANNLSGADATQATQHNRSQLENLLALSIDDRMFDLNDPLPTHVLVAEATGDRMEIGSLLWDAEANTTDPIDPNDRRHRIATGSWISDPVAARGEIIWQRDSVVRQYSYADIAEGVIDVTDPTQIISTGHPQLFDNALSRDAPLSQVNFKEEDITLDSQRPGVPSFRVRFWRTF